MRNILKTKLISFFIFLFLYGCNSIPLPLSNDQGKIIKKNDQIINAIKERKHNLINVYSDIMFNTYILEYEGDSLLHVFWLRPYRLIKKLNRKEIERITSANINIDFELLYSQDCCKKFRWEDNGNYIKAEVFINNDYKDFFLSERSENEIVAKISKNIYIYIDNIKNK